MESIDALAKAVNEFEGGLVLVSHDMRLISQVAREIWICDNKTITPYRGDIMNFKMDMRAQMGIGDDTKLKGDASVKATDKPKKEELKKEETKLEVIKPMVKVQEEPPKPEPKKPEPAAPSSDDATVATVSTSATSNSGGATSAAPKKYIPPHLRKKMGQG
eukprot:scaffold1722_cov120-Cylindrotheca_fusiformis.AAC.20